MIGDRNDRQRRRHAIKARTINDSARTTEGLARLRTGGFQTSLDGIPLALPTSAHDVSLIKTTGAISARSSTTPGSGNGVLVTCSATTLTADAETITLYSISGTAISTGKYGFAVRRFGKWWIISVEC